MVPPNCIRPLSCLHPLFTSVPWRPCPATATLLLLCLHKHDAQQLRLVLHTRCRVLHTLLTC